MLNLFSGRTPALCTTITRASVYHPPRYGCGLQLHLVACRGNSCASDSAVFNQSDLEMALENDTLGLPPPRALPGDDTLLPYFLI